MGEGKGLSAVLVGRNLGHDLRGDIAGSEEAVRLLDHGLADDRAVLQHILQIDQVAVMLLLGIVIRIMEMNDSFLVSLHDILRKKDTLGQVLGDLTCHIITLRGIDDRILVGVLLLHFLILLIDQRQNSVVGRIRLAGDLSLIAIADILLRNLVAAHLHDAGFHHVLNVLHIHRVRGVLYLLRNIVCHGIDLIIVHLIDAADLRIRLPDGVDNLRNIEVNLLPVPLYDIDFHRYVSFFFHHRSSFCPHRIFCSQKSRCF